jgi:hypothetical protein
MHGSRKQPSVRIWISERNILRNSGSNQYHPQRRSPAADLVSLARQASSMRYNPVTLSDAALTEILQKAW